MITLNSVFRNPKTLVETPKRLRNFETKKSIDTFHPSSPVNGHSNKVVGFVDITT